MNIQKRGNAYKITIYNGSDSAGKPVRHYLTFTPDPGMTEKQGKQAALKYALEMETKIKRGYQIKYDNLTFAAFGELYFNNRGPELKQYTRKQYEDIYINRLKPFFGNMRLISITPLDIMTWLNTLERSGSANSSGALKPNSKGVYYRVLSSMLGAAVKWGLIDNNPARRVTMPRETQTSVKALQYDEVNRLFNTIDTYTDPRAVILVYIFLLTGIRISEAAGLKWDDINLDNKTLRINREIIYIPKQGVIITPPKSINSIRDIYIPDTLINKLLEYKAIQQKDISARGDLYEDKGFIITQFDGAPVHSSTIRKWIKAAFKYCEIPYITVHGLRHTYASLLTAGGMDPRTTAAQLGHSTPALVMNIYANPQNAAKRRAADMIENITGVKQFAPKSRQNDNITDD